MKIFYVIFIFLFFPSLAKAQTVNVSGQCMSGTITLSKIANISGKVAYQGVGTVLGYNNIKVSIYWIGAPTNLWVIDYEGQPYFMNTCTSAIPPSSGNALCNWVAVPGTECKGSAALVVNGSGVLPVGLFGFTAQAAGSRVMLAWKTASETNNKGFEIQRSRDAVTWNKIDFVNGAINSLLEESYIFTDLNPLKGKNFYRLILYDLDGKRSFSPVVNVDIFKEGYYTLGNNPGNGVYLLNIRSARGARMWVSDMAGRRLINQQIEAGNHQLDISKYAPGIYLLHLQMDNQILTEKLIKQ